MLHPLTRPGRTLDCHPVAVSSLITQSRARKTIQCGNAQKKERLPGDNDKGYLGFTKRYPSQGSLPGVHGGHLSVPTMKAPGMQVFVVHRIQTSGVANYR